MIKRLILPLLLILALLIVPVTAIASDISGALWYGTIVVSNNSTATANVATTANISTDNFIAGNYLNSSANNTVMRNSSGADVPFMPGYTDANLWCMWVPTIGADTYLTYILYTAESSGGEIRYFPGSGGMEVSDNFTLELGNDFTINQTGWFNTSAGANKNLAIKPAAFRSYISSANITSSINVTAALTLRPSAAGDEENISNSTSGVGLHWQDVNDVNDATIVNTVNAVYERDLYECADSELANVVIDNVTVFARAQATGVPALLKTAIKTGGVAFDGTEEALPGAGWVNYSTVYFNNPNTGSQWLVSEIDALQIGVSLKTLGATCSEVWIEITYADAVIASGISSGEYTIATSIKDDPGVASYDTSVNIGVTMGSGIIPARILSKTTLSAATNTVTISNIDTLVADWDAKADVTSRHLVVMVNAASADAVTTRAIYIRFNGSDANVYNEQSLSATGAAPTGQRTQNTSFQYHLAMPGTTYANAFGGGTVLINNAFEATNYISTIAVGGAAEDTVQTATGSYHGAVALTSVTLFPSAGDFVIGSTFTLAAVDERYLVDEQILAGVDGTFDFDPIPQYDGDLTAIGYLRSDNAGVTDGISQNFNSDAVDANYFQEYLRCGGGVPSAGSINLAYLATVTGDTNTANVFSPLLVTLSAYTEGTNQVHFTSMCGYAGAGANKENRYHEGRWVTVNPITQIEYYPRAGVNFKDGSMMSLYHVPKYVIDRQELTAVSPTITFNNIPQNYEALQLRVYARSDKAAVIDEDVEITINADAVVANYDFEEITGTLGVVASATNAASQTLMLIPAAGEGALEFSGGTVTFDQYASTVGHKHFVTFSGTNENQIIFRSSRWEDTSAITRIDLDLAGANNFIAGSIFELVGVMPTQAFMIEVDGVVEAIEAANDTSMPDNANDWTFLENDSMMYLEYQEITKDDIVQQYIDWEYNSIFYDSARPILHFDGSIASNVNAGAINNGIPKLWQSFWFKLDSNFGAGSPASFALSGQGNIGVDDMVVVLAHPDGKLYWRNFVGGVKIFEITSTETSWTADTWYHVLVSLSDTAGGRQRLIINGGTAVTDAQPAANTPAAGSFIIGDYSDPGTGIGMVGEIRDFAVGTDDLSTAEEAALYAGTAPSDTVDFWYIDEGTGTTIYDYGTGGNNGTADTSTTWENGTVANHGTRNNATPTFRVASSDADVSANMTAFLPIAEATAPPYALSSAPPFISSTPNITGNFTTVPPTGGFPLAGVINAVANATSTPPQLPLLIIAVFIILAVSLCMSAVMRKSGSGTLIGKIIAIVAVMGIFIAMTNFGIDFWMLLVFLIMSTALAMASRQMGWS